jgi:hypothetical protein
MNYPEFQNGKQAFVTSDTVDQLKEAITFIQEPTLHWESADGEASYIAHPLVEDSDKDTGILENLYRLPDTSLQVMRQHLNSWLVDRYSKNRGSEKPVRLERMYVVRRKYLLTGTCDFDPDDPEDNMYRLNATLRGQIGADKPTQSIEDYTLLDNAVRDLGEITLAASERYDLARLTRSAQEERIERLQKIKWIIEPEINKTQPPGWWTISEGIRLYTVHASSADEAVAILDEHHETEYGSGILPTFKVDRCPDSLTTRFNETFDASKVVRLIPFSFVAFQEPGAELTAEQIAAWDYIHNLRSRRDKKD